MFLTDLLPGQSATVKALRCNGAIRRRFQDIGITPGTYITCVTVSPLNDPTAYLIKNTLIAIRQEDASCIVVEPNFEDNVITVALAGNPNVGKSTVFNALTGMKQHTGNWAGKTVGNATGQFKYNDKTIKLVDVPGCYSLHANSAEEEIARNYICFGSNDKVIVVCDATCLERNMNLVLQTAESGKQIIVCINMMDEARHRGIKIDTEKLQQRLGMKVVTTTARDKKGLKALCDTLICADNNSHAFLVDYGSFIEEAVNIVSPAIEDICKKRGINKRWLALRLLENDPVIFNRIPRTNEIEDVLAQAWQYLAINGFDAQRFSDTLSIQTNKAAALITKECVTTTGSGARNLEKRIDKIVTGKIFAFPIMLMLLALIFWITISGANYPSEILSRALFFLEDRLDVWLRSINFPPVLINMLVHGVYRVTAWIVSVMLPPMAIFFPLFTLLEDLGYLPRIAFNLDRCFKRCHTCGKQALTTCMGFGCNAVGIVGSRIIDSKRERLIAMLTNSFVPCNGRFPILIAIISVFFVAESSSSIISSFFLAALIVLCILMSLLASKLLSVTLLKGVPSSFTLELPPYRRPQVGKIIVRSLFDRTLFVLGRAVCVAAPAGLIIWILANIQVGGTPILMYCSDFLDPVANLIGLDGVILFAFILGMPANEIVIPLILMSYMGNGTLCDYESLSGLKELLLSNGWTPITALNTILFTLFHWPCTTSLLSIKKESGKFGWAAIGFILPTLFGFIICFITNLVYSLLT